MEVFRSTSGECKVEANVTEYEKHDKNEESEKCEENEKFEDPDKTLYCRFERR